MKKFFEKKIASFVLAITLLISQCSVILSGMVSVLADENNTTFSLYYYYEGEGTLYANIWNHAGITFTENDELVSWNWNHDLAQFEAVEGCENLYEIEVEILSDSADGITIYENSTKKIEYDNQWNNTADYATLVSKQSNSYIVSNGSLYTSFEAAGIEDPNAKKEEEQTRNDVFSLYYYYEGEGTLYANIWYHAGITFTENDELVSWGWDHEQAQFEAVEEYDNLYKVEIEILSDSDDGITIYENDDSTTLIQYDNKWNNTGDYATLVGKHSNSYVVKDQTIYTSIDEAGIVKKGNQEPEKELEWVETSLIVNGDFENEGYSRWTVLGDADVTYLVKTDASASNNTTNILNIYNGGSSAENFSLSQKVTLPAGTYKLAWKQEGAPYASGLSMTVSATEAITEKVLDATTGWNAWTEYESEQFTLTEQTEVTIAFSGELAAGYWGDLDNIVLYSYEEVESDAGEEEEEITPVDADVYVERVTGMSDDFITGADVSSYLSIINSGATFYDKEGNKLTPQGFFDLLAEGGTNYIRVRVWNDPYDEKGNGYGGGNNDLETAKVIGQYATKAGMKVLIDFHYSDFWADPGKQQAPKSWATMSANEKAAAVSEYTTESLKYLLDNGVNVGMVQVGNETTNSICGVSFSSETESACAIFDAGCDAVHAVASEYNTEILAAIHFTNPERSGNYANFAKRLDTYNVSYDVFASSYYPYWHGTIDNLTSVLKNVADTYGKKVMVAETSWAWTLEDGDGHDNTVRVGSNDSGQPYDFSVQGQCNEIRAVAQAVANVGDAGIGLFYWENAWIPVEYAYDEEGKLIDSILASNKTKWEANGSGWASSFAGEYDEKDAGKWYGGSAVDNQAWFDFNGKALDTVNIYNYIRTGTNVKPIVTSVVVEDTTVAISEVEGLTLPETATVSYNVGTQTEIEVSWDEEAFKAAKAAGIGSYEISGTVVVDEDTHGVVWKLTIEADNLLKNASFEDGLNEWEVSGFNTTDASSNSRTGNGCLHFYTANAGAEMIAGQTITVDSGVYSASAFLQGGNAGESDVFAIEVTVGDKTYTETSSVSGWKVWSNPTIENIQVSEDNTEVTVTLIVSDTTAGVWGSFDDAKLIRTGDYVAESEEEETEDVPGSTEDTSNESQNSGGSNDAGASNASNSSNNSGASNAAQTTATAETTNAVSNSVNDVVVIADEATPQAANNVAAGNAITTTTATAQESPEAEETVEEEQQAIDEPVSDDVAEETVEGEDTVDAGVSEEVIETISDEETPLAANESMRRFVTVLGFIVAGMAVAAVVSVVAYRKSRR